MDAPRLRSPGPPRLAVALFGFATAIVSPISAGSGSLRPDRDAPAVLVRPATIEAPGSIRLEARVEDASDIASVTAWARGEHEGDFRPVPLSLDGSTDTWTVSLKQTSRFGSRLSYFIEATDALGNGPRRAGSLANPYTIKLPSSPSATTDEAVTSTGSWSPWWAGTGSAVGLLVLIWLIAHMVRAHRRAAREELAFWHRLLDTIANARGATAQQVVQEICARPQPHPKRGLVLFERREVLSWLDRFREEIARAEEARIDSLVGADWGNPAASDVPRSLTDAERVADDRFWFSLLEPLTQLPPQQRSDALERLRAFPQSHPILGLHFFEAEVFASRIAWIDRMSEEDLLRRRLGAGMAGKDSRTPASPFVGRAAGVTMIEMLIVLALLAIGMVVVGSRLGAFERPLLTASQEIDAVIRETRARAMSTTSALRIRPINDSSLAVERALACGSATWTEEPRLAIDLPRDVTFTATDWEICYSSRGLTATNTRVTLTHPVQGSREVEVLLGGSARWTP